MQPVGGPRYGLQSLRASIVSLTSSIRVQHLRSPGGFWISPLNSRRYGFHNWAIICSYLTGFVYLLGMLEALRLHLQLIPSTYHFCGIHPPEGAINRGSKPRCASLNQRFVRSTRYGEASDSALVQDEDEHNRLNDMIHQRLIDWRRPHLDAAAGCPLGGSVVGELTVYTGGTIGVGLVL
jgi:hypothetical protein